MAKNSKGLLRSIPEAIKREVRQRCGFGCVVCGNAIFHYDHLLTKYAEAYEHRADDITLLCGGHHDEKSRGWLHETVVVAANANPACFSEGFARGPLYFSTFAPEIVLGNISCQNVETILSVLGERILYLSPPEVEGGPYLLNALLRNNSGEIVLRIANNEWLTPTDNWDVQLVGPRVAIKNAPGDIALEFKSEAPSRLIFERINMSHKGFNISCRLGEDVKMTSSGGIEIRSGGVEMVGCKVAIQVGAGSLALGVGGGSVRIKSLASGPGKKFSWLRYLTGSLARLNPLAVQSARLNPIKLLLGRFDGNQMCACGSKKTFKTCHGKKVKQ
jgi:SEC-C motif